MRNKSLKHLCAEKDFTEMNVAKRLGLKIRFYRKEKKMTQEKLAEICGFHPTYIGQLERGEKTASVETLYRISRGLNTSMCSLLDDVELSTKAGENENIPLSIYYQLLSVPQEKQDKVYEIIQKIIDLSLNH